MYYGGGGKRNGVDRILNEDYARNMLEVKRVLDELLWIKLENEGEVVNVINAYKHATCRVHNGGEEQFLERFGRSHDDYTKRGKMVYRC